MSKKTSFYLYTAAHRDGFLFNETSERRAELVNDAEWFEHPNEVPKAEPAAGNDGPQTGQAQLDANEQGNTSEPRYTLAQILHSSVSLFSIAQLAGEAMKHQLVLASVADDGSLSLAKGADEPKAPPVPPIKRETPVAYDNEAVAAMVLRGNTEPLRHEHFVALAKLLGVKHHKVKQADLIVQLKAVLEGAQPPQRPADEADEEEANEDEVVLGDDGKPVAPLKPNTD